LRSRAAGVAERVSPILMTASRGGHGAHTWRAGHGQARPPAARIREIGGGATQFSINAGNPLISASQFDLGASVDDDWKARPDLTLSLGLRYEPRLIFMTGERLYGQSHYRGVTGRALNRAEHVVRCVGNGLWTLHNLFRSSLHTRRGSFSATYNALRDEGTSSVERRIKSGFPSRICPLAKVVCVPQVP